MYKINMNNWNKNNELPYIHSDNSYICNILETCMGNLHTCFLIVFMEVAFFMLSGSKSQSLGPTHLTFLGMSGLSYDLQIYCQCLGSYLS